MVETELLGDLSKTSWRTGSERTTLGVEFLDLARQAGELSGIGRTLLKRRFESRQYFDMLLQRGPQRLGFFWRQEEPF